jgi:hypothetical protein
MFGPDGTTSDFALRPAYSAFVDAVSYGIGLLEQQPPGTRRVLLLSQPYNDGSKDRPDELVLRLGENSTTIYSLTFSPQKQWLKDQFTRKRRDNPPYEFSPGIELLQSFNLSSPLTMAWQAMQKDTASEIVLRWRGDAFWQQQEPGARSWRAGNHLPNRYTLTFRPRGTFTWRCCSSSETSNTVANNLHSGSGAASEHPVDRLENLTLPAQSELSCIADTDASPRVSAGDDQATPELNP